MTGPSAPPPNSPPRGGRPTTSISLADDLFGLWVSLGHYSTRLGRWLRQPEARFTCRHGCAFEAAGAEYVTQFTARIDHHHARHCPGPPPQRRRTVD